MNKAKLNYWIDLLIGAAFVLSAVSGIVFLFPMEGTTTLGITYQAWDQIHTWGSLLMVTGVLAHFVLHWKWLVHMTKKTFGIRPQRKTAVPIPAVTASNSVNRREFLRLAGVGTLAAGAAVLGYKALFDGEETAVASPETESSTTEQPESIPLFVQPSGPSSATAASSRSSRQTASCPKGVTYDPYPGRCHHYVDRDGDGYCDLSIPA